MIKGAGQIANNGLVFYIDGANENSYPGSGYPIYDVSNYVDIPTTKLNTVNPVAWSLPRFTTFDELSSNSAHFVKTNNTDWAHLGFDLLNKTAKSYMMYNISCTLEVITGENIRVYLGSSSGGYTEGPVNYYDVGTYYINETFNVANNYSHDSSQLEACFSSNYPNAEVRITNLVVKEGKRGGTLEDGASFLDNCFTLDGTNDFIGTGFRTSDMFSNNDSFSVEIWVKPLETIDANGGLLCNQKYDTESDPGGFGVAISATNRVQLKLTEVNTPATLSSSIIILTEDEYQQIVFTYNSITSTIKGYKNGDLENTDVNASFSWTTENRATLIGRNTQGGWSNFFNMNIANVKIYNKVLTDIQVKENYDYINRRLN